MISDIGRPLMCVSSCRIVISRLPSTSNEGRYLRGVIIEGELALLDEHPDRCADQRLGHRAHAEHAAGLHRRLRSRSRQP
jgi:hypothetical protein